MKVENLIGVFCILVFALVAYYGHISLQVGAAYSAKIVCSSSFTSGREFDEIIVSDIALPFPVYSITKEDSAVTSSTLFGTIKRTASYDPIRNSCTLLAPGETTSIWDRVNFQYETPNAATEDSKWPLGDQELAEAANTNINQENLQKIFDAAFHEPVLKESGIMRNTRAAIIVYDGKIIAERYAEGISTSTPLLGWSMTKSIVSTLIGLRVQEQKMSLTDSHLFPEWEGDERSQITLDQLLRASSGLEFQETNDPWSDVSGMLFRSSDYIKFAASKPLKHKPDTVWSYSSGTTNILSKLLRDSFKNDGGDAAYWNFSKNFFNQLGMESMVLDTDAHGNYVGSSFSHATARDWARFGLFAMNRGNWMGKQILEEKWFDYALNPTPTSQRGEYGAQWWLNAGSKEDPSNRPYPNLPTDAFFAQGYMGQTVAVIPSKKLVVVRLGATSTDSVWNIEGFLNYIVNEVISE